MRVITQLEKVCRRLKGTESVKGVITKVDCGWTKGLVKIFAQGCFPKGTTHQYINRSSLPSSSPSIPPTTHSPLIYLSSITHHPPPLHIQILEKMTSDQAPQPTPEATSALVADTPVPPPAATPPPPM